MKRAQLSILLRQALDGSVRIVAPDLDEDPLVVGDDLVGRVAIIRPKIARKSRNWRVRRMNIDPIRGMAAAAANSSCRSKSIEHGIGRCARVRRSG